MPGLPEEGVGGALQDWTQAVKPPPQSVLPRPAEGSGTLPCAIGLPSINIYKNGALASDLITAPILVENPRKPFETMGEALKGDWA